MVAVALAIVALNNVALGGGALIVVALASRTVAGNNVFVAEEAPTA